MKKAVRKTETVEYVTFADFVQIGLEQAGASIVNGVPQAFKFCEHNVTNESETRYLLTRPGGLSSLVFDSTDVLIVHSEGVCCMKREFFEAEHDLLG